MTAIKDVFSFPGVNNKSHNKEVITPHKIAVILLIREQCLMKEKGLDVSMESVVEPCNFIKGFCMLSLKLIQNPDMDYSSLSELLSGKHTVYQVCPMLLVKFHEQVEEVLREGVGALLDVFANAGRLVGSARGQVTKTSVLGLFLRRVLLHFDKLPFAQIVKLYKKFQSYVREPVVKEEDNPSRWSRKQAELFFAKEAARLRGEKPALLQEQISQLLLANPDYAEAHFLSFLNCVRSKEVCGAKTSLHHCFDRASLPPDKPTATTNTNTQVVPHEDRSCRYATLSLAAMHASFGHREEACASLKETIRLAHGAGDSVCLQHSLSWLYTLSSDSKEPLMERSMAKCPELGLSYLMSLGVQSYTKYCGLTGGRPAVVFDVLIRSDILNCQHMLSELAANAYCLKSALWTLYGQSNMASLCSQQLLTLNSQQPAAAVAMSTVARTLADRGELESSMAVLEAAQEHFTGQESAAWMSALQEITFAHSVNQSKYNEAMNAVTLLAPVRPWESVIRKAWLLQWLGDLPGSMDLAQSVLVHCRDGWYTDPELPPLKVRALVAAAETLAPGEALGCLLHALALSQTYYLHHLAAFITLHIANIQLGLCLPGQALRLTEASLPAVLSHGSVHAKGRALLLLARCRLAANAAHRGVTLRQSVPILTLAQEMLLKAHDFVRVKHCFYLKALIFNELGMVSDRNKVSFEFRQLDGTYPTPSAFVTTF